MTHLRSPGLRSVQALPAVASLPAEPAHGTKSRLLAAATGLEP
jgi:hypothetical protein